MKVQIPPRVHAFFWSPFASWALLALAALACLMSGCVSAKTAQRRSDEAASEAAMAQAMIDQVQCRQAIDMLNGLWAEHYCKMLLAKETTIAGLKGSSTFQIPKICKQFMRQPKQTAYPTREHLEDRIRERAR